MATKISRAEVWAATIEDKPGGLAEKLNSLAQAKSNLEFVIARRCPDQPGKGVVFLTPLKGAAQIKAAKKAGFNKTPTLHSVRIEGTDKPGTGAKITQALMEAGINLRGLSAATIKKQYVVYLAFDTAGDAAKAMRVLKRLS